MNAVHVALAETAARFEAATAEGPLALAVAVAGRPEPGSAVEAALHLAAAEPLLAAIDGWLAAAGLAAPAWAWATPGPAPKRAAALAEWAPAGAGPGVSAWLSCPWPLLRRLPEPARASGPLAELRWLPVPALCVRAALELAPDEADALEPGGVLLLPESFEPDAPLAWRAADEPPGAGVVVSAGSVPEVLEAGVAAPWEVRQAWSAVDPAALAGWPGAAWPDLRRAGPPLALWWHPADGRLARRRASGHLLPWGDGQAMGLDEVDAGAWT